MADPGRFAEITFREIVESLPISIWVEDFSAVVAALDDLERRGVDDLASYLEERPAETVRLVQLIRVLDVNRASVALYGAASKEELLASLDLLFTPQALAAFRGELVAVAERRPGYSAEVESKKLGGERLDLLISVVPARPDGDWDRVLVTATDITERKRAEAELAKSREQYKDLVEKAGIAIGIDRVDGSFEYLNDQFIEIFGYTQDELQRLSHRELVHPGDFEKVETIHAARLAGVEVPSRYEFRAVRRDGATIWIEVEAVPVVRDGEVVGTRSYLWDISPRKQLEAELRESRTSFASIVDRNTDGIAVVDSGGVVRFANPAACAMLQTPIDELVGSRLATDAYGHGATETVVRRSRGELGTAEATSTETTWDGLPAHLVVLRDVTERKQLEKGLLQAQKMEAVGRLAGGVAHEFNNLLQAMLSAAEARLAGVGDGDGAELLHELESLIRRGRSQTRQLLLFSRREDTNLEPLELNRVLRDNTAMLERLVADNVRLELHLADEPLPVRGDQGQLGQVLVNLVVNAADALPEGGRITIRSGRRRVVDGSSHGADAPRSEPPPETARVWFEVEDTGAGIPEHVRDRMFEPFFTTKERGFGTGLGLSVAHGIVTRHRGGIEVESRENRGARVRVMLPEESVSDGDAAARAEPASGLVAGRGERVLLVEDEPAARSGLLDVLEMLGYETVALGDAEQALALDPTPTFDVLVTDLMLPGLSGASLAEQLLARWPQLGIIVISGYTEDRTSELVRHLHTARFMHKPFTMAELSREIRAVLDRR